MDTTAPFASIGDQPDGCGPASDPHAPVWVQGGGQPSASPAIPSHPVFERIMAQMPLAIRQTFTPEQLAALSHATLPATAKHAIDYRISLPFFGRRYYLTILAGREQRSLNRLLREGQLMLSRAVAFYTFAIGGLAGVAVIAAMLVLYVMKGLLGVDLFEGSPMHDALQNIGR
jgi:hypothetical protein